MNYHDRVMNLATLEVPTEPYKVYQSYPRAAVTAAYQHGHRDARYAAAEIAAEADAVINELTAALYAILYADRDNHIPDDLHKQAHAAVDKARAGKAVTQ